MTPFEVRLATLHVGRAFLTTFSELQRTWKERLFVFDRA